MYPNPTLRYILSLLNYKVIVFFSAILLSACSSSHKFDQELQLTTFLKEEGKFQSYGKNIFVFMLVGGCDPCDEATLKLMKQFSVSSKYQHFARWAVIRKGNRNNENRLIKMGYQVYVDEKYKISHYGLDFSSNMLIEFSSDLEVVDLKPINIDEYQNLLNYYFPEM